MPLSLGALGSANLVICVRESGSAAIGRDAHQGPRSFVFGGIVGSHSGRPRREDFRASGLAGWSSAARRSAGQLRSERSRLLREQARLVNGARARARQRSGATARISLEAVARESAGAAGVSEFFRLGSRHQRARCLTWRCSGHAASSFESHPCYTSSMPFNPRHAAHTRPTAHPAVVAPLLSTSGRAAELRGVRRRSSTC